MNPKGRRMLMLLFLGVPARVVWLAGLMLAAGGTVALWGRDAVAALTFGASGIAVISLGWAMIMAASILSQSTKYTMASKRLAVCALLEIAVSLLFALALGSLARVGTASGGIPAEAIAAVILFVVALELQERADSRRKQWKEELHAGLPPP